jgi:hypothetical protein
LGEANSKQFFFEKKHQKTFDSFNLCMLRSHAPKESKFFLLLFLKKKKGLPSLPNPYGNGAKKSLSPSQ